MVNPNPSPFTNMDPTQGLAPNLIPTPPAEMPFPPGPADAMEKLSPFTAAQDVDQIVKQLSLDRPLPLFIPNREKYADYQFHIINDTPQELASALRGGWQRVDDPALIELFEGKVSGSDKTGRMMRPVLMGRHRKIGEHEAKLKREKLAAMVAGMDPKNRMFNSSRAKNVLDGPEASEAKFAGLGMGRIRV